jgi:hypothetical protein
LPGNELVWLTGEEIKALANLVRVAKKMGEDFDLDYVQRLLKEGGDSGYEKLLEKLKELDG